MLPLESNRQVSLTSWATPYRVFTHGHRSVRMQIADVPLEALVGDENLAALEAGQEAEDALDSADLEDLDGKPKKKGKAKAKAKASPVKKTVAEQAPASSDMQVRPLACCCNTTLQLDCSVAIAPQQWCRGCTMIRP